MNLPTIPKGAWLPILAIFLAVVVAMLAIFSYGCSLATGGRL